MKVLSIVSSYRKDGNTARTVTLVEKQLEKIARERNVSLTIERISLGQLNIQTCRGCRVCFDAGEDKCVCRDELLSIRNKMLKADGFIVASPVYVEDVNGIMKNWIDRMAFLCHRPAFAGKIAYVLTTSGIASSNHAIKTIGTALSTWGISVAGKQKFSAGALMQKDELQAKYEKKIDKAAKALFSAIVKKDRDAPTLYSLIAFTVQQKYWRSTAKYRDTYDYAYWAENGWLDKGRLYYTPIKTGKIKAKAVRLIGRVVAMFFVKRDKENSKRIL